MIAAVSAVIAEKIKNTPLTHDLPSTFVSPDNA
jgi:hypothetical protein